jgi:hypothetical protein
MSNANMAVGEYAGPDLSEPARTKTMPNSGSQQEMTPDLDDPVPTSDDVIKVRAIQRTSGTGGSPVNKMCHSRRTRSRAFRAGVI